MDIVENLESLSINNISANIYEEKYLIDEMEMCSIREREEEDKEYIVQKKMEEDGNENGNENGNGDNGDYSYEKFQMQLSNDVFQNNFDVYHKDNDYCRKLCLEIPNIFSKECVLDDEDYIYTDLRLPDEIMNFINEMQSIQEYTMHFITNNNIIINYNDTVYNIETIYAKTLYIYQFVHYYNTTLNHYTPQQRINNLPCNLLVWVDNLIILIKQGLTMKILNYHNNDNREYINISQSYIDELLNGLNICVLHLKMIINHCKTYHNLNMWSMDNKYITKFFKVLNNLCVIIIFMKLVC